MKSDKIMRDEQECMKCGAWVYMGLKNVRFRSATHSCGGRMENAYFASHDFNNVSKTYR